MKVPVVVIGAGACGLTAALAARDAGAEVLVLERDASPSGSTALSSGFVPAAGTRFQAAGGVEDSPERMFQDVQRKNGGHADPKVARILCETSGPAIEWLADAHGVPFELVQGFRYPGHSALRMHSVSEKTGAALMAALLRACSGLDLLCSARVVDVTSSKVVYERPNGEQQTRSSTARWCSRAPASAAIQRWCASTSQKWRARSISATPAIRATRCAGERSSAPR